MPDRGRGIEAGIVGAGVLGSTIAYALARRKISAVLVDPLGGGDEEQVALAPVFVHDEADRAPELVRKSAGRLAALQEEIGPFGFLRTGRLTPALSESDAQAMTAVAHTQPAGGLPLVWLPREEALRREPALSPDTLGALSSPQDGVLDRFMLVRRLLAAFRALGGISHLHCRYVDARTQPGGFLLAAGGEAISVRRLVLAGAEAVTALGPRIGAGLPVGRGAEYHVITNPRPPLLRHSLMGAHQTAGGEVILGGASPGTHETPAEVLSRIARRGCLLVPELTSAAMVAAPVTPRTVTPDGGPVVGPAEERVYVALAPRPEALCPAMGESLAEAIARGRPIEGVAAWSPARFRAAASLARGGGPEPGPDLDREDSSSGRSK